MSTFEEWAARETRRQSRPAFARVCVRRRKLKTRLDCGHVIDGSELYRYQVWKWFGGGLEQRMDCELCARVDAESWRR